MSRVKSAGVLLFKRTPEFKVLIVHPSGGYNKNAPWSIPKGKIEKGETIEQAARREVWEEVGIQSPDKLDFLEDVVYKSGKRVYIYSGEVDDAVFPTLNWECDKAEFVSLEEAEKMLLPAQKPFIQRLRDKNA